MKGRNRGIKEGLRFEGAAMSKGRGARVAEHESASKMVGTSKKRGRQLLLTTATSDIHAYSQKASNLALPKN